MRTLAVLLTLDARGELVHVTVADAPPPPSIPRPIPRAINRTLDLIRAALRAAREASREVCRA